MPSYCVFWLKETATDSAVVKLGEMSIWPQKLTPDLPAMLIIIHRLNRDGKFGFGVAQGYCRIYARYKD